LLCVSVDAIEVQVGLTVVCGGTPPRSGWPSARPLYPSSRSCSLHVLAGDVGGQVGVVALPHGVPLRRGHLAVVGCRLPHTCRLGGS